MKLQKLLSAALIAALPLAALAQGETPVDRLWSVRIMQQMVKQVVKNTHPSILGAGATGQLLARDVPVMTARLRETRAAIEAIGQPDVPEPEDPNALRPQDARVIAREMGDIEYLLGLMAETGDPDQLAGIRAALEAKQARIDAVLAYYPAPRRPAQMRAYAIEVPATFATGVGRWLDTGIALAAGDYVTLTASGQWRLGPGPRLCDGSGLTNFPDYQGHLYGTLLARVGDGEVIAVGTATSFVATAPGHLFLGNNDANTEDNSLALSVAIDVD
ncbi:hypothetical protein [Sinisalibacter aestuarii]|uniref:Uncharacterized protein n=1 Tax=Sinisalibacter aestuarii TaxID=2949426 RepID=A0ABQ5LRH4_9RHOB|nr:hypothetical protein [Sinisalibacter aestuarii]GKY87534.1 hypothetical protein STA1M1_14030 [Sinisalibacter aestuarii]